MGRYILLLIFIFSVSCTTTTTQKTRSTVKLPVISIDVKVGEVVKVRYPFAVYSEKAYFMCRYGKFPAYYEDDAFHAYIAESYFSDMKSSSCDLFVENENLGTVLSLTPVDRPFPIETLTVAPKKIFLSQKDQMRVRNEQAMLNAVFADSASSPLFNDEFIFPLNSYITSYYGVKRIFNGQKKGQHLGIDFRAKVGVPIPVSNNGRIVYAGDLFYTGKTIIVDHGVNVFTVYGHLSKFHSELGEYVPKGAIVGISGATGRVSGPHLHWGVKVSGHYVDGASLIRETKKLSEN